MPGSLVATQRTTPTKLDFAKALLIQCPDLTKETAGVLWAHFAGETGDGAYCWNFNLGNVKHTTGDGRDYVSLAGVWEGFKVGDENGDGVIDADDKTMLINRMCATGMWLLDLSLDHAKAVGAGKVSLIATKNNAASWFRAYPTLEVGMVSFVDMKRDPKSRYAGAWAYVLAGDADGYARELGRKGYYTASPDVYARAMVKKHAEWMADRGFDDAHLFIESVPADQPSFDNVTVLPGSEE